MWQRTSDKRYCERITVNGKKKLITAKSKAELNKKLKSYNTYAEHGRTFKESAEAWEDAHESTIEYKTVQTYRAHVKRAVEHFSGEYMKDITPDEIQAYIEKLGRMRYAKDTVGRSLGVLNMIFDWEIVQPDAAIRFNPCSSVKVPKNLPKTRREPPTEEQIAKVTPDSEMGLFAFFLLYTGLRRGELLALKWEDIDFDNRIINVRQAITYPGNQPKVKAPKTAAGNRKVALLDILANALPKNKHGYVFGGNAPLTASQIRIRWLEWCKEVGLAEAEVKRHKGKNNRVYTKTKWHPLVTPHQFRHEYASMLEDAKISEFDAMSQLGHASIMVTKDIYTHIRERKAGKNVADTLNEYIKVKNR